MLRGFFIIAIQLAVIQVYSAQTDSEACNSCCTAGVPGIPGNHGNPGVSGPQGVNGEKGIRGEQGEKGEVGMNGEQGINGQQGIKGEQGEKGDNGRNGLDGIPGKLGPKGPQGIIGQQGATGPQGISGQPGEVGRPGVPGEIGQKREKGEQANLTSQYKSAFSAVFRSNPGQLPISPLKYDTIITDVGNHYNKDTGKFVCEIPGVYVFQVTSRAISSSSYGCVTHIIKNGDIQVTTRMTGDYSSSSTMVILDLVSGDQVWTQPYSSGFNYYYSNSDGYCSFSGFLLYAA